jgi:hypothetical protein
MFERFNRAMEILFPGVRGPEPLSEPVVKYQVIQLKAPRTPTRWSQPIKDAVATLPSHPGFNALMERIALQKQMLEHKCSHEFHKDLREADYLQAGVFWLEYAQRLVEESTKVPHAIPTDAFDEELEAFQKLDAQIERIGMEPSQGARS